MEQKSDNIILNFKNTKTKVVFDLKKKAFTKGVQQDTDLVLKDDKKNNLIDNFFYDQSSIVRLEQTIKTLINKHRNILSQVNLPSQIDVEFLRTSKIKQFLHSLSWNKNEKPYGESTQERLKKEGEENPKILISTDFVKDFSNRKHGLFGHLFLDTLRNKFFEKNYNKEKTKQIITELTVIHELAHIVLDKKIKNTFLKYYLELPKEQATNDKGEPLFYESKRTTIDKILGRKSKLIPKYKGQDFKKIARILHEGFADGFCAYITNLDFPNDDIIETYKQVREFTEKEKIKDKKPEVIKRIIPQYDISYVLNNVDNIPNTKTIDIIFELALQNTINVLDKKLKEEDSIRGQIEKEFENFDNMKIFQYNKSNDLIQNLNDNIKSQLLSPLPPLFPLPKLPPQIESKQINMFDKLGIGRLLNNFRKNNSNNQNKLKR